ncbi:MAG: hypothetical protein K1X55_16010 [Chitinophagales bacterium]|nr:hypothetical protein [Chitinophagales bacterium]
MKRQLLNMWIMLLLSVPMFAFGGVDISTLTKQAWKFDYAFKPITSEIVPRTNEGEFLYLKFESTNTFTLASNEKVEMGTWSENSLMGTMPNIIFGFKGIDQWNVIYCEKETFVISNKTEKGLVEYHFVPATSQKDMAQFTGKINTHIEQMKAIIKSYAPNSDNTRVENNQQIQQELENKESPLKLIAVIDKNALIEVASVEKVAPVSKPENDIIEEWKTTQSVLQKIRMIEEKELIKEESNTNNIRSSIKKTTTTIQLDKKSHIEIYVSGGGLKGGINPTLSNVIMIQSNGSVIKNYESKLGGKISLNKKASKEDLIKLATYIVENGYFDFNEDYNCPNCAEQLKFGPQPIPLKMIISIGELRHTVSVPVYAPGIIEGLSYPKELDKILAAIYEFAS